MRRILAGIAAVAAVACAPAERSREFVWRCDGGSSFSTRFARGDEAFVDAGGERYVLPIARSASGARYSDGTVEFWEHQGEAWLKGASGGPYLRCKVE